MSTPSATLQVQTFDIFRSVKTFFGLSSAPAYRKSRIRRKPNQAFEEFIFKGYDQKTPGLFRPGSFKALRPVCKN